MIRSPTLAAGATLEYAGAVTVLHEPAFGRWHVDPACAVVRTQPDALVARRSSVDGEGRACTICVGNALPPT